MNIITTPVHECVNKIAEALGRYNSVLVFVGKKGDVSILAEYSDKAMQLEARWPLSLLGKYTRRADMRRVAEDVECERQLRSQPRRQYAAAGAILSGERSAQQQPRP